MQHNSCAVKIIWKHQHPPGLLPSCNHASNSRLFCSLLPFFSFYLTLIHSYKLWMSQCSSCIQRVGRSRALSECGGGRVETTEQRWSLKVRCERDVAEQALSLCYTAGSVTTDCSPAPLLSSPSVSLCSITPPPPFSDVILFLPTSSVFVCLRFPSMPLFFQFISFYFFLCPAILPFSFRIIV